MALNVNREVDDAFYRYKMPKLIAKVEGKGNGIKTVIVNMVEIAKSLYRKPIYPTKFFGCELGAQIYVDEKNERYIVNGSHEAGKLQELLHCFIKKFVLCQKCDNPETVLSVKARSGIVTAKCKACGHTTQLDAVHRLTQFIIKNPPDSEADGGKAGKSSRKSKKNGKSNGDSPTEEDDNDDKTIPARTASDDDNDEDDWAEETTEEARLRRMADLTEAAKMLALSDELEKTESERADIFYDFILSLKKEDSVVQNTTKIKKEAERLNLGERIVMILMEVLLSRADSLLNDIEKYKTVFMIFTRIGDGTERAQRYMLGSMEKIIKRFDAVNMSCHILKKMYDVDIIEEEAILGWSTKGATKRYVDRELSQKIHDNCQPMITWLKQAEEESEDEEDENEDDEISFSNTNPVAPRPITVAKPKEDDDDELDIDAI